MNKNQLINLPNLITLGRMILIPFFILSFYLPIANYYSLTIFIILSITDWLDGFVARYYQQTTYFGAFLDPVVDKLVVCIALVMIVSEYPQLYMVIPAIIIIAREIAVSALREWMSQLGMRSSVSVSTLGKIKTIFQFIALILLINKQSYFAIDQSMIHFTGIILLYIASILTLWSMFVYLAIAYKDIKLNNHN